MLFERQPPGRPGHRAGCRVVTGMLERAAAGGAHEVLAETTSGNKGGPFASGDDVWANAQPRPVSDVGVVWMLRGPEAKPVWHVPESASLVQVFETLGGSGMVGDAADGLWAAPPTAYDEQQVVRIDPVSGASD